MNKLEIAVLQNKLKSAESVSKKLAHRLAEANEQIGKYLERASQAEEICRVQGREIKAQREELSALRRAEIKTGCIGQSEVLTAYENPTKSKEIG